VKTAGLVPVSARKDVCWKDPWALRRPWVWVTSSPPSKTRLEPSAVYWPRSGPRWFQYRVSYKPKGATVLERSC
jgi:hypothetical protein